MPFKQIIDQALIDAIAHPARAHVLTTLNEKVASPSEVAEELGVDVRYLNYHFEELEKNGFIELVETKQVRGATKHFYRAKAKFFLERKQWERLPASLKSDLCINSLSLIREEVARALGAGTFSARDEVHVSEAPLLLDPEGFSQIDSLLSETLQKAFAIAEESARRMKDSADAQIRACLVLMSFETPSTSTDNAGVAAAAG